MVSFLQLGWLHASCLQPFNIQQSNSSLDEVEIAWSDFSSDAIGYEVSFHQINEDPDFSNFQFVEQLNINLNNLTAGMAYHVYIRTVCENNSTNWSGPFLVKTHIDHDNNCEIFLPIIDDNCTEDNQFIYEVNSEMGNLGDNSFIGSVSFTIQHDWPSDISFQLTSPSGITIPLLSNIGIGQQDFGNPDQACEDNLTLSQMSCISVYTPGVELTGTIQVEGSFDDFYDGSNPNGLWKLELCDQAEDQEGTLLFFSIQFFDEVCQGPQNLYFTDIAGSSANISIPNSNCDTLLLVIDDGIGSDTIATTCDDQILAIQDLEENTAYQVYTLVQCSGNIIEMNCSQYFTTKCDDYTLQSDFDNGSTDGGSCDSSPMIDSIWFSVDGSTPWIIENGPSNTNFTGPESDQSQLGNYILAEASQSPCKQDSAVLQTQCLWLEASSSCELSFYYHMYGNNSDSIALEISVDGGSQWTLLWAESGNKGQTWNFEELDLDAYDNVMISLRFVAFSRNGEFGDVALDDIQMYGVSLQENSGQYFYVDSDGDGWGIEDSLLLCTSSVPIGFAIQKGDCNDENSSIHPNAEELGCNALDDNCNGEIDETGGDYEILFEIDSLANETCYGSSNGYLSIEATGGVEPYQFIWEDGVNSSSRNDLSQGNYSITIEDAEGCKIITNEITIDVIQNFPGMSFVVDEASCLGVDNGQIEIFPPPIGSPFTIDWSNGDSTALITNLSTGNYELTLTDKNGCNVTLDFDVGTVIDLDYQINELEQPSCYDFDDGKISIVPINGVSPYSYQWGNGQNSETIDSLSSQLYHITVTDATGCILEDSIFLDQPDSLSFEIEEKVNLLCNGDDNGLIDLNPLGGTGPYEISWDFDPSENDFTIDNLQGGNYAFTIQDSENCTIENQIELNEPEILSIQSVNIEPSYCLADNSGSIAIETSGGTYPYTYFWDEDSSSTDTINNLPSGDYSITIIDEFQCKLTTDLINVPYINDQLSLTGLQVDSIACKGDENASFQLNFDTLGQAPFQYTFLGETQQTDSIALLEDLSTGEYFVYGFDNYSCPTDTIAFTISEPQKLESEIIEIVNANCFGANSGSIQLESFGGTGLKEINWNTGDTTFYLENIPAGDYFATIYDENNCLLEVDSIAISQPDSFFVAVSAIEKNICNADSTGFILLSVNGGTEPYDIQWNTGDNSDLISNLPAGQYSYIIDDAENCGVLTDTFEIFETPPVELTNIITEPAICEANNGQLSFSATGGSGGFNYFINGKPISDWILDSLKADNYEIYAMDSAGCKSQFEVVTIEQLYVSPNLDLDSILNPLCYLESNGQIISSIDQPLLKEPFIWNLFSNGTTVEESPTGLFTELEAGDYELVFSDVQGCRDTIQSITLIQPDELSYELLSIVPNTCHNSTDGIIIIEGFGGTGELNYIWQDGTVGNEYTNPKGNSFYCQIIDSNNCQITSDTFTLLQPDSLHASAMIEASIQGEATGSISVDGIGGVQPYKYKWTDPIVFEGPLLENIATGLYTLELTDSFGCVIDTSFFVDEIVGTKLPNQYLHLYPNPAKETFTISSSELIHKIDIYSSQGTKIVSHVTSISTTTRNFNVSNLPSGTYIVQIQFANGRKEFLKLLIQ